MRFSRQAPDYSKRNDGCATCAEFGRQPKGLSTAPITAPRARILRWAGASRAVYMANSLRSIVFRATATQDLPSIFAGYTRPRSTAGGVCRRADLLAEPLRRYRSCEVTNTKANTKARDAYILGSSFPRKREPSVFLDERRWVPAFAGTTGVFRNPPPILVIVTRQSSPGAIHSRLCT